MPDLMYDHTLDMLRRIDQLEQSARESSPLPLWCHFYPEGCEILGDGELAIRPMMIVTHSSRPHGTGVFPGTHDSGVTAEQSGAVVTKQLNKPFITYMGPVIRTVKETFDT